MLDEDGGYSGHAKRWVVECTIVLMFVRGLERDLACSKWTGLADEDGGHSGHAKRWVMQCDGFDVCSWSDWS